MRAIRLRAALVIGLLAVAGCGSGGGGSSSQTVASGPHTVTGIPPTASTTIPQPTQTTPPPPKEKAKKHKNKSPESQPGGAGDETPIATQALFTAKGGKVSPSRVRVPPFIAVKIVLRAVDEKPYTLIVNGKEVAVGEGRTDATLRLDGLRPGGKYVIHPQFGTRPKTLVIVANAEPGP